MKGMDVSYFQGNINWKKVKESGIDFVIPREGYGKSTTDSKFFSYVKGALAEGIKIPGVYHFSYALTAEDAKKEALSTIKNVEKAGLPKSTIIFFDLEYDSVNYAKGKGVNLNSNLCIAMTKEFCDTVYAAGYIPGVYFNVDYYRNYYANGKGLPVNAVRWLANWGGKALFDCDYHQTSEKGVVDGINGNVDLDTCLVSLTEAPKEYKPVDEQVVADVLAGKYGNGDDRRSKLYAAGYDYDAVQSAVNKKIKENEKKEEKKPEPTPELPPVTNPVATKEATAALVLDIIAGKYGNGDDRKKNLAEAGYDYDEAQSKVNDYLKQKPSVSPAKSFDNSITGKYTVNAAALNCRFIPGVLTFNNVEKILYKDEEVQSWGYYTQIGTSKWYLIQQGKLIGWVDSKYLTRK